MTTFTIERQYLVPMYQHLTIEADTPEAAMRIAMAHEDWYSARIDFESGLESGLPHHISGCWTGPRAYEGEACPVPRDIAEPVPRVVVVIEGGVVQTAIADTASEVTVIDYDTGACDPEFDETYSIPQSDLLPPKVAYRCTFDAEVYPDRVDQVKEAPLHFYQCDPVSTSVKRWMNFRVETPWPSREQRVLWRASFTLYGCLVEVSHLVPVTTIEAATDTARRCLDELWPDQVEKLDQSFLLGQAVQS